jgi:hypothetical protein
MENKILRSLRKIKNFFTLIMKENLSKKKKKLIILKKKNKK